MATSQIKQGVHWGARGNNISLPFTAPTDGIITVLISPQISTSASYVNLVVDDSEAKGIRLFTEAGVPVSGCCPIKQGEVLREQASSNLQSRTVRFLSLVGGGNLTHKRLSPCNVAQVAA